MKQQFLKTVLPILLLVVAAFIIGSSCSEPLKSNWYLDADLDGYGNPNVSLFEEDQPPRYVSDFSDCDDTNANINPEAFEIANNLIDEDCNNKLLFKFFVDNDGDGFGNPNEIEIIEVDSNESDAPNGFSWVAGDCNDEDDLINPQADEIAGNEIDENCNGIIDTDDKYIDDDGDGYGSNIVSAAEGVNNNIDCDDNNNEIHPYMRETQNGIDDDCDNEIDEI